MTWLRNEDAFEDFGMLAVDMLTADQANVFVVTPVEDRAANVAAIACRCLNKDPRITEMRTNGHINFSTSGSDLPIHDMWDSQGIKVFICCFVSTGTCICYQLTAVNPYH